VKLSTVIFEGVQSAAIREGRTYRLLDAWDVGELLRLPGWRRRVLNSGLRVDGRRVTVIQPVVRPEKILCIGHNYQSHIREMGRDVPEHPDLFSRFADSLTGPLADITIPAVSAKPDWEVELAAVIGQRVRRATADEAAASIAGYMVVNDVSAREWQRRGSQWLPGKNLEGSAPCGPELVTTDEFDPKAGHEITCEVNGAIRQKGNTSDLLFSAADIIRFISTFTTLNPGDVVFTGTPSGVGAGMTPPQWLQDGDRIVSRIDGLGELRNTCILER
jgi:acylpyruvate hydrolase